MKKRNTTYNFGKLTLSASTFLLACGGAYGQATLVPYNEITTRTAATPAEFSLNSGNSSDNYAESSAFLNTAGAISQPTDAQLQAIQTVYNNALNTLNGNPPTLINPSNPAEDFTMTGSAGEYFAARQALDADPGNAALQLDLQKAAIAYNANITTVQSLASFVNVDVADSTYPTYDGSGAGPVADGGSVPVGTGSIQASLDGATTSFDGVNSAITYYQDGPFNPASASDGGDLDTNSIEPIRDLDGVNPADYTDGLADADLAQLALDDQAYWDTLDQFTADVADGGVTAGDLSVAATAVEDAVDQYATNTATTYDNFEPLTEDQKSNIMATFLNGSWERNAINGAVGASTANSDALDTIAPDQGNMPVGGTGIYGIAWKDDQGVTHLGDESVQTVVSGGQQAIWAESGGNKIDINIGGTGLGGDPGATTNLNVEGNTVVSGNSSVTGDLDVDGLTELDGLNVDGATTLDDTTIDGDADLNGNLDVDGLTELDGLNVDGASTLDDTTIDGALTANGGASITGGTTTDTLNVTGGSTLAGGTTMTGGASVTGGLTADTANITGDADVGGNLGVVGTTTTGALIVTNDAAVGGDLGVAGNTALVGDLDVDGATTLDDTTVDGVFVANGGSTLNGGTTLNGGATVNGAFVANNGATVIGTTTTTDLSVTNSATIGNDLTVVDDVSVGGDLGVAGDTALGGSLTVTGPTALNGGATIANGLNVTGGTTTDNLTVSNNATVNGFTTLDGGAQVNNGLDVNGGLTVDGGATINNGLTVNGGIITDTLNATTVNATNGNFTNLTAVNTTTTDLLVSNSATVNNDLTVGDQLIVQNDATIADQLTVGGFTQLNGGLDVVGNTETDTLTVNSDAFVGDDLTVNDQLFVNNSATISNNLTVGGSSTVGGNSFVGGSQTVTGNSFVNGSEFVAGNSTVGGNVNVGGDVFVGGNPVGLQTQVNNLKGASLANQQAISSNNDSIKKNSRGIAMTAALTTMTVMPGMENAIDFHVSYFDGKAGFSVGYARRINENIQVDVSAATSNDFEEGVVRAGASYQW